MEIKYGDNVVLKISITSQMVADWREHCEMAQLPGGGGKDCNTCSLNINIDDGYGICEMEAVRDELNRLAGLTENESFK